MSHRLLTPRRHVGRKLESGKKPDLELRHPVKGCWGSQQQGPSPFKIHLFIYLNSFIYLSHTHTHTQLPPASPLPKGPPQPGLDLMEACSPELYPSLLHGWSKGPAIWAFIHCHPRHISRKVDWKGNSRGSYPCSHMGWTPQVVGQHLSHHKTVALASSILTSMPNVCPTVEDC